MTGVTAAVVFEYDAFPPVPKQEWEGSELHQALLLAGVLAEHLSRAGLVPEQPIQEDFGAVLPVSSRAGTVDVIVSFYPRESSDFTWALQFRQTRGLLRTLLSRRQDERIISPVREAVRAVVAAHASAFRNANWVDAGQL